MGEPLKRTVGCFFESMEKLLLSILILVFLGSSVSARGWRGIIPLHSTRADIESLVGKPSSERNDIYHTDKEFVRVDYAKGRCEVGRVAGTCLLTPFSP